MFCLFPSDLDHFQVSNYIKCTTFFILFRSGITWPGIRNNLFGSGRPQRSRWIRLGSDPGQCRAYLIFFFTFVPGPSLFTKTRRELCTLPKASQSLGKFSILIFYFFLHSCLVNISELLASLPSFSDKLPNKRAVLRVAGGKFRCCRHKIF
jgi:hypothetical protein